nr:unnamed protein product [Callosobruchus analis]
MDAVEVVQFCYLVQQFVKNKKRKNRRWWVHPINSERYLHGHSVTLLPRLRSDPEKFFNYFRMCPRSFDELLNFIKDQITHDIGSFGKVSDATIFQNSSLWKKLENKCLNIPKPTLVPGIEHSLPFAFVGDEAFGLSPHLLRPYSGKQLASNKRVFNYRLSRARRYIECTFGIMSNKWRILHRSMDVDINFAVDIIKCLCILHNFVRKRDGYRFEDTLTVVGLEDAGNGDNININKSLNRYRDALANYFVSSSGEVPWQYDRL